MVVSSSVLLAVLCAGAAEGHSLRSDDHPSASLVAKVASEGYHLTGIGPASFEHPYADVTPIVVEEEQRKWWGFPNYDRDHDFGVKSWPEFAREHGRFGSSCTPQTSLPKCGTSLVCTAGICVQCLISRDCGENFRCEYDIREGRRLCIPRDLPTQWHWREVLCTFLIILTAMLSAAAGMGGGGVYVPLCLLLLGLSTKEAIPLSQAMILGGACVNVVMFCGDRHPKYPHRAKIDYDVLMMLNPGLAAGVTLGVICHMVSPQWLTVFVLIITLVLALQKSLQKGIQAWQKESRALADAASRGEVVRGPTNIKIKMPDFAAFRVFAVKYQKPLALIISCWTVFLVINLMKAPSCSRMYWMQILSMMVICGVFTFVGTKCLETLKAGVEKEDGVTGTDQEVEADGMLQWTPKTLWLYPLLTTVAGFLGGFLGIGGGIILSPLLLELGLHPEANQATTAMFVFLSSSLASLQFIVLGKGHPQFVVWFTTWVILATFVGQTGIDYLLKKWQRNSLIILSIAGIIAGSLLMMSIIGTADVLRDIDRGADMGFHPGHLCHH